MPSDVRDVETKNLFVGESSVIYCFDFSDEPIITSGGSISSPTISSVNSVNDATVTYGTPEVLTTAFTQLDRNGLTVGTVASGKGVKVAVTPGATRGQVTATCLVTGSDGSIIGKTVYFKIR